MSTSSPTRECPRPIVLTGVFPRPVPRTSPHKAAGAIGFAEEVCVYCTHSLPFGGCKGADRRRARALDRSLLIQLATKLAYSEVAHCAHVSLVGTQNPQDRRTSHYADYGQVYKVGDDQN